MSNRAFHQGSNVSRRAFAKWFAAGGSAALLVGPAFGQPRRKLPPTPAAPTEAFWKEVRAEFLMPADLAVLNAANLCPASLPAIEALERATRAIDADPSMENRRRMGEGREASRRTIAECLRAAPEEILITRNTSEGNNIVSSGVALDAGDDVVISSENHPSSHQAWREKAKRFGFTVTIVDQVSPFPGADYYVDAFAKAMTPRTKVLAVTHVTASNGELMPVKALCRMAREREVLTLVDGAQSFGVLDIDLSDMQPDFFTGSAHKWPCGPREVGVLYVNSRVQPRLWPSIISLYAGAIGVSRTHGALGQRDEAAMIGFGEALTFQAAIGRKVIEARSRALAARLMDQLARIDGVKVWTPRDPSQSAAIVMFRPGNLDPAKLVATLYGKERIACTARGGGDRGGIRLSPHFYNLESEIDRTVAAVRKYMASGVDA